MGHIQPYSMSACSSFCSFGEGGVTLPLYAITCMLGLPSQEYRPAKLDFGMPHPDPVVETASLASVEPPDITYQLHLDDLVASGGLSALQLESIVYACQRHEQALPDGQRAGFFIGDGAGVGKGRTIAGDSIAAMQQQLGNSDDMTLHWSRQAGTATCLCTCLCRFDHGELAVRPEEAPVALSRLRPALRFTQVWCCLCSKPTVTCASRCPLHDIFCCINHIPFRLPTVSENYRDLDDVGAQDIVVQPLNKLPYGSLNGKIAEGVIFLTYSSLISSSEKVLLAFGCGHRRLTARVVIHMSCGPFGNVCCQHSQGSSRLEQLVSWCGPDFDGLIVYDECHKVRALP